MNTAKTTNLKPGDAIPGRAYAPREITVCARYTVPTFTSNENDREKTTAILAF